jgi:type I site-specific restriction endonuclease
MNWKELTDEEKDALSLQFLDKVIEAADPEDRPKLPPGMESWGRPLAFAYESTGVETTFTNALDPEPASCRVFSFHRPETLAGSSTRWAIRISASARPPCGGAS